MTLSRIVLNSIALSIERLGRMQSPEWCWAGRHLAEWQLAEWHWAEWHWAEWHWAEWH